MKLTPEDIAFLQQSAQQYGYTPQDVQHMQRVINYESSGRPDAWGGKGGDYFGLIQFGPNERRQFHVDTEHPNARNQIEAMWQFMKARGYKPGMGLLDAYSTVNAGSPGHYKASDGNGTVSSHVAKMLGQPAVPGLLASTSSRPNQHNTTSAPNPVQDTSLVSRQEEDLSPYLAPQTRGVSPPVPNISPEVATDPQGQAMLQQMMDYHKQLHSLAVKGLI